MRKLLPFASLFCVFASLSAGAQINATVYTDPTAFAGASTIGTTVTFNGIAPKGSFTNEGTAFTLSKTAFSTSTSTLYVIDPGFGSTKYAGGDYLTTQGGALDELDVTLASSTAISFNYGGLSGPASILVELSDGVNTFDTTLTTNDSIGGTSSLDFAGFTTSTPFTELTLLMSDGPNYNALDNLAYGTANPVPEPSTLALVMTGLGSVAGLVRRRG